MVDNCTYYLLQVWSETKSKEFWDCAIFARDKNDDKGVARFIESTPRLSWMSDKKFTSIWAYLVEQKRLGRLLFSMTEENKTLKDDLFRKEPPSSSR